MENTTTQQNLNQIRAILKQQLGLNDEKVNLIFKSMTDIDKIKPYYLDNFISLLKNNYSIKDYEIFNLMVSNPPADLFKPHLMLEKMKLFNKLIGTSAPNFKYAILNNPHAFARTNDELENYIFELKRDLGMNNEFVLNLLTHTHDFAHNIEDYIPLAKHKMEYLYAMGLTPDQIAAKPGLLGNTINSISTRLIYALCNDITIDEYLNESLFISTEEKIHARTCAYKAGLIKKEHIYEPEAQFIRLTGYKTEELKKVFPFNMHAKAQLLKDFGEKFPELSAISIVAYKKSSENIHQYKQQQDALKIANGEKLPANPVAKRKEALESIKVNLGLEKINTKEDTNLTRNYDRLISMGFSSEEILSHPQALLLTSDKLMWRIKLAKINGLSNIDFLTHGYKFDEMKIFPRTCGVRIMNTRSNATTSHIYNTESVFSKTFGESTRKLAEHCKLNETGRKLLDRLYMQAVNAESTQEENA